MESTNSRIKKLLQKIDGKVELIINEGVRLVGILKNNFYFSKFTIDKKEIYEIYQFVTLIKTELFKTLSNDLLYSIQNIFIIQSKNPLKTDQQIYYLFGLFFYHYYTNFSYDLSPTFEQFFSNEFYEILSKFKIIIINQNLFGKFAYSFFTNIQQIISKFKFNHENVQKLIMFYNPNIEVDKKNINKEKENEEDQLMNVLTNYIEEKNKAKETKPKKKLLKYLISAKEYLVDLVLETKQKHKFMQKKSSEEIAEMIETLKCPNSIESENKNNIHNENNEMEFNLDFSTKMNENKQKEESKEDVEMTDINNLPFNNFPLNNTLDLSKSNSNKNISDDNTSEDLLNTSSSESSKSFYSKRVLNELTKMEVSEENKKLIEDISEKVDDIFLDILMNHSEKSICAIQNFLCYRVHVDSKIIRLLPEYKTLKNELTLEYIVTAKNIYYRLIEIYFSLHDLLFVDIDIFRKVLQKKNVEIKFFNCYFKFLEGLSNEIKNIGNSWGNNIKEVLGKFIEGQYQLWDKNIVENGRNLTYFCMV